MAINNTNFSEKDILISPGWFARIVSGGKFKYPAHIALLDKILADSAAGRFNRVIVNMPPRHGKSELVSKYFPAWYLLTHPGKKIILTSYEATFAESWGRKVRDLIKEYGADLAGIELDKSSSAVSNFSVSGGGAMTCAGAGGPITGKGADLLIIDDPVKNDSEANSPVYRDKIWDWFLSTAYTRLEPEGVIFIIMTRWHEDDLCGRLERNFEFYDKSALRDIFRSIDNDKLMGTDGDVCSTGANKIGADGDVCSTGDSVITKEAAPEKWLQVKLPAIATEDDPIYRKPGEPLWKGRFPLKKLYDIRTSLGSYWFSSLYMQNPTPLDGGIFKRKYFKYFRSEGEFHILDSITPDGIKSSRYPAADCPVFATLDLAAKSTELSDYTAGVIFAVTTGNEILILDVLRERFEGADHLKLVFDIHTRYRARLIGIESVQYQISLVQTALRQGLPVKALVPSKDKVTRALPISAKVESGMVYFRRGGAWLGDFESELLSFPNGKHDDQVDAFAYITEILLPAESGKAVGASVDNPLKSKIAMELSAFSRINLR